MIINHNLMANNAINRMNVNSSNASKSMQKLSSGLRINNAADDAAGLAISEKMRGQIRGLDQASANAQDGISMVQTAEGALSETTSILQRMRELAVQAGNDTNTTDDRKEIQKEMNQLTSEINRIGNTTEFNTQKLLNGNKNDDGVKGVYSVTVPTVSSGSAAVTGKYQVAGTLTSGKSVTIDGVTLSAGAATGLSATGLKTKIDATSSLSTKYNTSVVSGKLIISQKTAGNTQASISGSGLTVTTTATGKAGVPASSGKSSVTIDSVTLSATTGKFTATSLATAVNASTSLSTKYSASVVSGKLQLTQKTGNSTAVAVSSGLSTSVVTTGKSVTSGRDGAATLQIGANEGQTFTVDIGDMRSKALKLSSETAGTNFASGTENKLTDNSGNTEYALDITDAKKASAAITTIDSAIKSVSSERSKLGAYQNRLEHTIANLGTSSENLTSAESRIRDVDMAKEMSTFSKNNILSQAAQAMLAQANQPDRKSVV